MPITAEEDSCSQGDLAKKALKQSGGGVQKQGAAKGKVKAVPLKAQRGGGRGSRGGGAGGRGSGRQQLPQALHPAALKITIRNDKVSMLRRPDAPAAQILNWDMMTSLLRRPNHLLLLG